MNDILLNATIVLDNKTTYANRISHGILRCIRALNTLITDDMVEIEEN